MWEPIVGVLSDTPQMGPTGGQANQPATTYCKTFESVSFWSVYALPKYLLFLLLSGYETAFVQAGKPAQFRF